MIRSYRRMKIITFKFIFDLINSDRKNESEKLNWNISAQQDTTEETDWTNNKLPQ